MDEKKMTLMELLNSRENRAHHQRELLDKFGGVLISMTLNIPGPVKDKPEYRRALRAGMDRIKNLLTGAESPAKIVYEEIRELPTGAEGFLCVRGEAEEVKQMAVSVEEADSLGRLFDIDVLTEGGSISRSDFGTVPRRCLLCGEDAKVCARDRRHPMDELLAKIEEILKESGI